jgi:anti-anti-sigma factor
VNENGLRGSLLDRIVPVTFIFSGRLVANARRVSIIGPFNHWNPNVHPLRKAPDGDWVTTLYLTPGRIVYYFDVDGTYWLDPDDDGRVPNAWGSEYSVRHVNALSDVSPTAPPSKNHVPVQGGPQLVNAGVEETPDAVILHPSGEVDLGTLATFREMLAAAATKERPMVIEMSAVDYIDSAGMYLLIDCARSCRERGGQLILAAPKDNVRRLLEIASMHRTICVVGSREAALNLLRARAHR